MTKKTRRETVVSIRMTTRERMSLEALAAATGMAPSRYMQALLQKDITRSRPTLAAAGAMLAICHALIQRLDADGVDTKTCSFARQQAGLVLSILKLHGHAGYVE